MEQQDSLPTNEEHEKLNKNGQVFCSLSYINQCPLLTIVLPSFEAIKTLGRKHTGDSVLPVSIIVITKLDNIPVV